MAQSLSAGNQALALLGNTLPTGAILVVLILVFGPISGAHLNPAVSLVFALRRELYWPDAAAYTAMQLAGAVAGVWIAHVMFDLPVMQFATTVRSGPGQWVAEAVAAFGLVLAILGCIAKAPAAVAYAVGLYITAAYWFTASTSFANPAVTVARSLSDTFPALRPAACWRSSSPSSRAQSLPRLWHDGCGPMIGTNDKIASARMSVVGTEQTCGWGG